MGEESGRDRETVIQNGARRIFSSNPDLADFFGRTDLGFENFYFFHLADPTILDFLVPRVPKFGLGRAGLGPWGWG